MSRSDRIEEIFLEIVDLPHDRRAARMDELCGGDAELRQELTRLLAADDSRLSAHDAGVVGGFASDPVVQRVGEYAVSDIAGEGGMGSVYDAVHEPTRRRAAVKLLHVATSTALGRSRMRIEAETLGRLDSPNIARLYDAGVAEVVYADGRRSQHPFIAMEFVQGKPITEFAHENKLTDRQRLSLMQNVAQAVHHAHQRGVMHRDLKPRNVLVIEDGTPKVVDFGIARLIDAAGEGVTQTGQLLGTLRYMSPEQTAGDHHLVDTRTDVYALGAILYELLAGKPMVSVDTGASLTTAMKILQSTPPRITQLRPELAGDVEAIVHKATALEADDRYSSAQALADDLRCYLEGRDITARRPTAFERFGRFVRRNKAQVAVAATIALLLLGGIIGTSWGLIRAERARHAEIEQRLLAERNAAAAKSAEADSQAFGRFLVNRVLATARPASIQGGLGIDVKVIEAIKAAEQFVEADFKGRPAAEALARKAIGATYRNRGDLANAEKQLRRAEELALASLGPADGSTLDIQNSLLVVLEQLGRNDEGIRLQEKIAAGFDALYGPRDHTTLSARYNLAIYQAKAGNYATSLPMLEQVYAGRSATLGPEAGETLSTLADIAEVNLLLGQAEKGLQIQRQLVDTMSRVFGQANPQTLTSQYRLACLLRRTNQPAAAAKLHEQVIPQLERAVGAQNVTTLDAKRELAQCYLKTNQFDRAAALMREYCDGQSRLVGQNSPQALHLFSRAAVLFLEAGEFSVAEEFARRALTSPVAATESAVVADVRCVLGRALVAQGRLAEAEPILLEATAGQQLSSNQRRAAAEALIQVYEQTGRHSDAESLRRLSAVAPTTSPAASTGPK